MVFFHRLGHRIPIDIFYALQQEEKVISKNMRRTLIIGLIAVAVHCFLFVGCNGESQENTEPLDAIATVTSVPTSTSVAIERDEDNIMALDIASPDEPWSYDVHRSLSSSLHLTGPGLVYSRLLRFSPNINSADLGSILECDLCSDWVQIDQTTYRFTLRDGAKWHNIAPLDGRLVTVEDLVYSYQRQKTEGWPNSGLLQNVSDVVKIDDSVLEIRTHVPDSDFVLSLAAGHSKIVPAEVQSSYEDVISKGPIGTGPWVYVRDVPSDEHVLESNPLYYEAGLPKMDVLRIRVIPDQTVRFASMAVGEVDFVDLTAEQVQTLRKREGQFGVVTVPYFGHGIEFVLNTSKRPLGSLEARQTIFRTIDPWRYSELYWPDKIFNGLGFPARHASWQMTYEELRAYVGQSTDGEHIFDFSETELTLSVGNYGTNFANLAEEIVSDLRAVAMSVSVETISITEYVEMAKGQGSYDMYLGPSVPLLTSNQYFFGVLHSEGTYNASKYKDPGLDLLIELQAQEMNPLSRTSVIKEIDRRAMYSATRLMVATDNLYWGWDGTLHGVSMNPRAQEYFHYAYFSWNTTQ